jgi:hypothetical protein
MNLVVRNEIAMENGIEVARRLKTVTPRPAESPAVGVDHHLNTPKQSGNLSNQAVNVLIIAQHRGIPHRR